MVGGLTLARRASASTLARSANSGSSSMAAATCCCACESDAARSRMATSRSPTGVRSVLRGLLTKVRVLEGSEVGAYRAGHAIVVIDREQHAPFVEGRARMRNAAADQLAD